MELLGRKEKNSLISVSVCLRGCITVYMNCGIKNLEMSHMFVQSGQDGCEYCQILYKQMEVWMARWLKVCHHRQLCACQYLWMVAANDLPMFEKGVMMGRMIVSASVVRWDNK